MKVSCPKILRVEEIRIPWRISSTQFLGGWGWGLFTPGTKSGFMTLFVPGAINLEPLQGTFWKHELRVRALFNMFYLVLSSY
jgi:hypothetical protein